MITVTGNVVAEVELRFVPSGAAVANFRIASTPRTFDKSANEFKDGETLFLGVTVWRDQAEHVAESITKGMRVIVTGRLTQRQYEDREGQKRSSYDIQADEVGPSLRSATAVVTKATNGGQGSGQRPAQQQAPNGTSSGWGAATTSAAGDPWSTQQSTDGTGVPF